jgi:hypothetical protein
MELATTIFLAGILGVFLGMGLIYISIRFTSLITDQFAAKKEET